MNKYFKDFRMLVEDDLEQAKLVIAAEDVLDRLQKIAEHLAELGAEEIMPLSDNMKAAFGADIAANFEKTADQAIQKALEAVRGARDIIDSSITRIQGNMDALPNDVGALNDMADDTGIDSNPAIDAEADQTAMDQEQTSDEQESLLDNPDSFGGADAATGALGRMKKESVKNKKAITESFRDLGKKVLMKESIGSLVSWVVEDAKANLSPEKFEKFRETVQANVKKDPIATAGWIGLKKETVAGKAQTTQPTIAPSVRNDFVLEKLTTSERKARGLAKVIEANIIAFGHGKASQVVNQFTSTDLNESSGKKLIEDFKNIFGMSPAAYSVKLKKEMLEDSNTDATSSVISPSSDPDDSSTTMTNDEKSKAMDGIGKIASEIANNPGNGNRPVASATAGLPADQQNALNGVKDAIADKNNGEEPETVNDLLKNVPDALGENELPEWEKNENELIASHSPETLKAYVAKNEKEGKGDSRFVRKVRKYLDAQK